MWPYWHLWQDWITPHWSFRNSGQQVTESVVSHCDLVASSYFFVCVHWGGGGQEILNSYNVNPQMSSNVHGWQIMNLKVWCTMHKSPSKDMDFDFVFLLEELKNRQNTYMCKSICLSKLVSKQNPPVRIFISLHNIGTVFSTP